MNQTRLVAGDPAPHFSSELWDGTPFDLESLAGHKIWLAFFRYASCPLCNLRVHQMIEGHELFEKFGLKIVAVFQSPKEAISEYVGKQKPPFPLVADPEEKLYGLYRLESSITALLHPSNLPLLRSAFRLGFGMGKREGTVTRIPADFLIDARGVIRTAYYGKIIGDHIPILSVTGFAADGDVG